MTTTINTTYSCLQVKFYCLLLCFLGSGLLVQGQEKPEVNYSSPQKAIYSHLVNLQEESYYPERAAMLLHFYGSGIKGEERTDLAIKLKQIYDGLGFYIDIEDLPAETNYRDSTREDRYEYVVMPDYPEIYLQKINGRWKYSRESVKKIAAIHAEVFPFGSHYLLKWVGRFSKDQSRLLGMYAWQYLGVLLLVLIGWMLRQLFTLLIERLLTNLLIQKGYQKMAKQVVLPVARPLSLYLILGAVHTILPILQLPARLGMYLHYIFDLVLPALLILVGYRLIDVLGYYLAKITQRTATALDDQVVPLVVKALKLLVILLGTVFALDNLGYDITGLLAGISIGGLAVALAAQDTIKHLFGSFMIFIDRPFTIGDWIVADGIDGTVIEVGFRSTRIQTFHNSVVSVPNGYLADRIIDNMGLRVYRRYKTEIAITYDTPADLIEVFVEGLKAIIEAHPQTRKDFYEVALTSFGGSSLNILFYAFFQVPEWSQEIKAKHDIMIQIIKLAQTLGVRFAFPTTTVHVEEFPDTNSLTPQYKQDADDWRLQLSMWKRQELGGSAGNTTP